MAKNPQRGYFGMREGLFLLKYVVFIGYLVSETCLLQKNGSILARNPQRGYFGIREGLFWLLGLYWRGAILDFTKFE